ncbi:hypothetical protein CVT24_003327 [Panaeolus cyanescens]|uniref:NAD(P)-binding protein n=1 Tax=Panaeolus cyanescens TaxID=181874 RepID=A0A409Y715_9AGAR|nr:hypothetical protein CVT24_003327 [Panaeolus cyanescens]
MSEKYVWFVTGTSTGLGNCLLHELLVTGHSVIATARKPETLQATLDQKYDAETLKRVLVVKVDITQEEEVKAAFASGIQKFGHIDIVVNNAGYAVLAEVEGCPMEEARTQFEVMFWGAVYISKEAVRVFREVNPSGKGGQLLNVSSVGGYTSQPTLSYYDAAKFALEGFTESLRKEMSPEWNIQATIIEPGGFNTEWRGANMSILPIHPAYDTPTSPVKQYRDMFHALPFIGSPERAAKAFVSLAGRRDLPLRIQFGSDSLAIVRHMAATTIADSERFESLSHSTNIDGINPPEYTKALLAHLG